MSKGVDRRLRPGHDEFRKAIITIKVELELEGAWVQLHRPAPEVLTMY